MIKVLKNRILLIFFRTIRLVDGHAVQRQNEALFKRMKRVGEGCRLNGVMHITASEKMELGQNVHIGDNARVRAEGGLSIGDNTHISRNLVLYTINHNYEGDCLPYDDTNLGKAVTIGDNVWIGANVCVIPGVEIEEGAIIGMGAVVCKRVPRGAIVGGNPARVLKYRDMEHYEQLKRAGKFGEVNGKMLNETGDRA